MLTTRRLSSEKTKLRIGRICVVIWPVEEEDEIQARPSVIEYTDKRMVVLFVNKWNSNAGSVSVDSLIAGAQIESRNKCFVLGVHRGPKDEALDWAWGNHPNPLMRKTASKDDKRK